MSRLYKALQRMEGERRPGAESVTETTRPIDFLSDVLSERAHTEEPPSSKTHAEEHPSLPADFSPKTRLLALTDSQSLGAEKFRALATRLCNLRRQREMKSLQITSSSAGEGKTLIAGNLAATIAAQSGSRVLLVDGDLQRSALTLLFGAGESRGLNHWWSRQDGDLTHYVYKMQDLPLWFLGSDRVCDQPSQILQSARFVEAFNRLADRFDWIIVDSAPMLPTVCANQWSRLLDGTLLVVREGVTLVNDLKKGLEALDNPKLVGIVFNESSELSRTTYAYYPDANKKAVGKNSTGKLFFHSAMKHLIARLRLSRRRKSSAIHRPRVLLRTISRAAVRKEARKP